MRMYIEPGAKTLVVQKRIDRHIKPDDFRCKDCAFRGKGKMMPFRYYGNQRLLDYVCFKRVKKEVGGETYYFGAPYNRKPCELFQKKEK